MRVDPMSPGDEDFFQWDFTEKLAGDTFSGQPSFASSPSGFTSQGIQVSGLIVTFLLQAPNTTGTYHLACTVTTSNGRILTRNGVVLVAPT